MGLYLPGVTEGEACWVRRALTARLCTVAEWTRASDARRARGLMLRFCGLTSVLACLRLQC